MKPRRDLLWALALFTLLFLTIVGFAIDWRIGCGVVIIGGGLIAIFTTPGLKDDDDWGDF